MQKWTYFSMGVMAGLILLLGGALLAQGREPSAHAAMQGVDNQGKYALAIGGSAQGLTDMLWVLHEHSTHPALKVAARDGDAPKIMKDQQISLCLYKITRNGDRMQLVAARNIAYDIEIQDLGQDTPRVREVIESLQKQIKKD